MSDPDAQPPHLGAKAPTAKRSTWVDATRGVAIVLVVIGHVIQFGSHDLFDEFTNPVFVVIYAFHMPLFALVSGYLALSSLRKYSYGSLITLRVRGLLVPFAAWTLVGGAAVALLRQLTDGGFSPAGIAESVGRGFVFPESSLWFLWVIFCCYVIAATAALVPTRYWLAAAAASIVLVALIPLDDVLAVTQLKWLYPFFVAGAIAKQISPALAKWERIATPLAIAVFVLLLTLWQRDDSVYISRMSFSDMTPFEAIASYGYRYAIALAGSVAVIGIVRIASRRFRLRLLARMGVISLGIYAVQTYPLILLPQLPTVASNPALYFGIYVPAVSLLILAISILVVTQILDRVKLLRVIFLGGR